jgi:hypothetical protein
LPPSHVVDLGRSGRHLPALINILLMKMVEVTNILKKTWELIALILISILKMPIYWMRVTIGRYLILISSKGICLLAAEHKNQY